MNNLVIRKYAKAAFNVAKKSNLVDQFEIDLNKFTDALSKRIIKELSNPAISRENLKEIIIQISEKLSLHRQVMQFLEVIANARRISLIEQIQFQFSELVKIEKNILEIEIFSAHNLDEKDVQNIKEMFSKKYSNKIIQIKQLIKKDILGGLQIKVKSTMIDASLKGQLSILNQQLQSIL